MSYLSSLNGASPSQFHRARRRMSVTRTGAPPHAVAARQLSQTRAGGPSFRVAEDGSSLSRLRSGRQLPASTKPESPNRWPPAPGSRRSLRSGDLGLKNGPSVSGAVGSSPSRQEGVGASSCVRTTSALDSSHPAASMPVLSRNRRRVGFDSLFMRITKLMIDMNHTRSEDVTADRSAGQFEDM